MADGTPSPAGEAGGQVEETQPQGTAEGGSEGGMPGEVAPPKPRQRREKLPGVVTRDDGEDIFPDLGFKGKTGKRVSRDQALREAEEELRGEDVDPTEFFPAPPEQKEDKPKKAEEKSSKVKFAGKEYETLEEVEQSFKSLQGMFKPMQERLSKAEALAEQAAESARLWRERAMEYETGKVQAQRPQQQQQPQNQASAQQELEAALQNVDGELFERLAQEHGLPIAGRYLAAQVLATVHDQLLPALRKEIIDQLMPEIEPLKEDRGFQQATQHVASLIETVGSYKNADGSDAFPELSDPQKVWEIGDLWRSLNLPADVALTPQGLLQAVALYRMYNGGQQTPSQGASATVSRPENTAPRAAGQSLDPSGSPSPMSGRATETEASRFARALEDVRLVDPLLGFQRRRR